MRLQSKAPRRCPHRTWFRGHCWHPAGHATVWWLEHGLKLQHQEVRVHQCCYCRDEVATNKYSITLFVLDARDTLKRVVRE